MSTPDFREGAPSPAEDPKQLLQQTADVAAAALAGVRDPTRRAELVHALDEGLRSAEVVVVDAHTDPQLDVRRGRRTGRTREEVILDRQRIIPLSMRRPSGQIPQLFVPSLIERRLIEPQSPDPRRTLIGSHVTKILRRFFPKGD